MYLKSITMRGFKSFAERTQLEFGAGTSVVVGPNGSGKSNVTDAILWAFGEQSPLAVRGQSMQDVIFAGAPGRQAAGSATVELVLDDSDGVLGLGPEVSVTRRLDRNGDGEYRIGGSRCRLTEVLELLSDTGLGKEMHSVVSQGRIDAIVNSRPRDRRLLIEEAAGLGKHRKRRRRAQIKLEHTQDNLGRALDVEREARSRLRPLKRQAEAAELHERVHRQMLEIQWELAREELRVRRVELAGVQAQAVSSRALRERLGAEFDATSAKRRQAEEALATHSSTREELSRRSFGARAVAERVEDRADTVTNAAGSLARRAERAERDRLTLLEQIAADVPDQDAQHRIAELERELDALARDHEAELARQLRELAGKQQAAVALEAQRAEAAQGAASSREHAAEVSEHAREGLRAAERTVDAARRESARVGSELAAVNQFLRGHQAAPGGAQSLADAVTVAPGFELAVAAALDGRLGAALLGDRAAASRLLDQTGRDGGRVLILDQSRGEPGPSGTEPVSGAVALTLQVAGDDAAAKLARRLLADAWLVDDLDMVRAGFRGLAVTRSGRVFAGWAGELRQAAQLGEERVLAERNHREQLLAGVEAAARAEQHASRALEQATAQVRALDGQLEQMIGVHRAAVSALDDASETVRRLAAAFDRRRTAPDEGPGAEHRLHLQAQLEAERERLGRAEEQRQQRAALLARIESELDRGHALAPQIAAVGEALRDLRAAILERKQTFDRELADDRAAGERLAGELRECAQAEAELQSRLQSAAEGLTAAEVAMERARDREGRALLALGELAGELELEPTAATEELGEARRADLAGRLERLEKRREQIGPINPLAKQEYADAVSHVEELEAQRNDMESALRELEAFIRDTDREIRELFQQTFESAAVHFEALAARVFPGGHGRLRLLSDGEGQAGVIGAQALAADDTDAAAAAGAAGGGEDGAPSGSGDDQDRLGVEIELTPLGKSMKRLSLLSGGEKSMTALAFLFAVFLARPCPFYVLDEVEAALDDLNITRFLDLLDSYRDRAQFIVVTHQKRTMEAADALYGIAMGGDGVSKVISRRLPTRAAA